MSDGNSANLGKLVIKASIGADIRILPINNEDLTYDELVLMMQRVFKDKLANIDTNTDLSIKYKDTAGDLVSVLDTSDLTYAIQESSPLLRLHLYYEPQSAPHYYQVDGGTVQALREQCHGLLALLDNLTVGGPMAIPPPASLQQQMAALQLSTVPGAAPAAPVVAPQPLLPPREFDPLSQDEVSKTDSVNSTPSHSAANSVVSDSKDSSNNNNSAAVSSATTTVASSAPATNSTPSSSTTTGVAAHKPSSSSTGAQSGAPPTSSSVAYPHQHHHPYSPATAAPAYPYNSQAPTSMAAALNHTAAAAQQHQQLHAMQQATGYALQQHMQQQQVPYPVAAAAAQHTAYPYYQNYYYNQVHPAAQTQMAQYSSQQQPQQQQPAVTSASPYTPYKSQ